MYKTYFDLRHKPFDLIPNPNWLFLGQSHKKILSYLDYGIRERVGFILLTGEIGSGKTTIIRNILQKYHSDKMLLANIFNTRVNSTELISMINEDFGIVSRGQDKTLLLKNLNSFLIYQYKCGNCPTLIIDEAQNLSVEVLEEVRLLSNLETYKSKLLQIILIGQPELREILSLPEIVQLRQRININCHLYPLAEQEIIEYILYRLELAGNKNALLFKEETAQIIYRYTKGIPRLINILCDYVLLAAFAENLKTVDPCMIDDIAIELDFNNQFWGHLNGCIDNYASINVNDCCYYKDNNMKSNINIKDDSTSIYEMRSTNLVINHLEKIQIKIDCLSAELKNLLLNPDLYLNQKLVRNIDASKKSKLFNLDIHLNKVRLVFSNLFHHGFQYYKNLFRF